MLISLNWIKDYVNLDGIEVDELVKRFGLSTAEVEGVEYKGKDGKTYKASTGSEGGKTIKRTINAGDTSSLSSVAQNEYNLWCYDGYEGSLTGWLLPYCAPTDMVHLMDPTAQHQDGTYYVVGTEVNFSNGGGRRKVTIGRKM